MKPSGLRFWIFAAFFLFVIFKVLAVFTIAPAYDEMVQNYMAYDISRLVRFPVYFDGQLHMGPIESYFMAPFFRWFGFTYIKARIYYGLLYISFLAIFLWIVRKLFDPELTVYLWVLLALAPFSVLYFTTIVGYEEILTLAILSLFILLKISYSPRQAGIRSFFLGAVSGAAFWSNAIFVIWFPPLMLGLWMALPPGRKKGTLLGASAGIAAGASPIWIHGFKTGEWLSLIVAGGEFVKSGDLGHFIYLFFARMKYFLTTFTFSGGARLENHWIRYASIVPFAIFAVSFGSFVYSFLKNWRAKPVQERILFLFMALPPVVLTALYSSRQLSDDEGIRYFLPLMIPYAFVTAWWIRQFRFVFWKWAVLCSMVAILSFTTLHSFEWVVGQRSELVQIYNFLREKQLRYGIAEMNLAYPLNALDHGSLVVTPVPHDARYTPVLSLVREKGPSFLILEKVNRRYREQIEADPALKKESLYGYDIFYGQGQSLKEILK